MTPYISDIAFTPAVKAVQERLGSRTGYARMEETAVRCVSVSGHRHAQQQLMSP